MERWPFIVQYTLGVGVTCLGASYLAVVYAFVRIMLDPAIDNGPIYDIIKQSYRDTTIVFGGVVVGACVLAFGKLSTGRPLFPTPTVSGTPTPPEGT